MEPNQETLNLNDELICNFRDIGHTIRHFSEGRGSQKRILALLRESGTITQRELTRRLWLPGGKLSVWGYAA